MSQKYVGDLERLNLEKLASALRTAKETEEIASVTSTSLHEQTEQLHRISHKQDVVEANLKKSSRIVTGMDSVFGRIKNVFTKKPKDAPPMVNPDDDPRNPDSKSRSQRIQPSPDPASEEEKKSAFPSSDTLSRPGKQLVSAHYSEQEEQMLGELTQSVDSLKVMARNIGDTLDYHNELLDGLEAKNEKNTKDMAALQKRTTKLLR